MIEFIARTRCKSYACLLFLSLGLLQPGSYTHAAQDLMAIQRMAEHGDAQAQFNLGGMYANGEGVAQDAKQAVAWYRKAAEQGHAGAQSNLGAMYANGEGVAQDLKQAVAWYRKAAEQGMVDAQYSLGLEYAKGEGIAQDYKQAYIWASVAAANGDSDAKKLRDIVSKLLSQSELTEAQQIAGRYFEIYQAGS